MIGLAGAHRCGKTALAREYAKRANLPLLETSTAAVFKAAQRDPKAELPIAERIATQKMILAHLTHQWSVAAKTNKKGIFVTDRTPIDAAMYMLADIQRTTLVGTPLVADLVLEYVDECFKVANQFFGIIVLVQPGIAPSEKEGSAAFERAYQEHLNAIALGLLTDDRVTAKFFRIGREFLGLEERCQSMRSAVNCAVDYAAAKRLEAGLRGELFH